MTGQTSGNKRKIFIQACFTSGFRKCLLVLIMYFLYKLMRYKFFIYNSITCLMFWSEIDNKGGRCASL